MSRFDEVKLKLEQTPAFRERRHRSHFLTIMAFRDVGVVEKDKKIASGDKITATIEQWKKVGPVYGSYERAWREVMEKHSELRGSDYNNKEELVDEKLEELGYRSYTNAEADKAFNEI